MDCLSQRNAGKRAELPPSPAEPANIGETRTGEKEIAKAIDLKTPK